VPSPEPAGQELRFRIYVTDPPAGVWVKMQRGRGELVPAAGESGKVLRFDFTARVDTGRGGKPNFLGPFTQGPPDARFVYINSGTAAGQHDSAWSRRAKIPLMSISWQLIEQACRGAVLETDIPGTGRDGGPTCATVKDVRWRVNR
jgi:hypothetical protein